MFVPTLPQFNMLMDVWNWPRTPAANLPDFEDVTCQPYYEARRWITLSNGYFNVRTPADHTKFFDVGSILELAPGSTRFVRVDWCVVMHEGFPNEYWSLRVVLCDGNGAPTSTSFLPP